MKKSTYLFALALGTSTLTYAQNVGINTDGSDPDSDAILHINNHSGSSADSSIIRIENEQNGANDVTGVEIYNSGTGATAKWDVYIPASGSTDLRFRNNGTDRITLQNDGDVGIGTSTPNASAILDLTSTSKGLLTPRLTQTQRNAISAPATGLLVYQTDNTPGFYYYDGTAWQAVGGALPTATNGQTLRFNGTDWIANSVIYNDGTDVGINTDNPNSMFDVQGSMGLEVTTITGTTTLDDINNVVLCGNGPYTVTLPAAASCTGRVIYLKNIDAQGDPITIDGNGSDIEGRGGFVLGQLNHVVRIVSDGTDWHIIEESAPTNTYIELCNGSGFTWNDVTNPTTGETWMDRNLGATRVASSSTDADSYGDLYQWGRLADGHQCTNSGTTTNVSTADVPGHDDFIRNSTDWRSPRNDNLWQGVNGTNNPCPTGYRLPTTTEWTAERNSWSTSNSAGAFGSPLRLSLGGTRNSASAQLYDQGNGGFYWTSTVSGTASGNIDFGSTSALIRAHSRSFGFSVRCIKD